jgi:Ca2+-binding EF-hand superfamily protein
MSSTEEEPKDVTSNEEKELKRVYDYLANYFPKSKLMKQMKPKLDRKQKILQFKKNPEAVKIVDEEGNELTMEQIDRELERLEEEIEILQEEIDEYNAEAGKKISAQDLQEALRHLGKRATKKEIEDMIWEVDENLDGCVDWEEFHLMFQRNIKDKTGLEPFQLFNVVQFMMYDRDNSGAVSVDETMHMLYARYGKERLEAEMKALFGDKLRDGDGSLSFGDYLQAVNQRLPKHTEKTKKKKRR